MSEAVIELAKRMEFFLGVRESANRLFDEIEALPVESVTVDFARVDFMSSVFAVVYLKRKESSRKVVVEAHVSENVEKMFEVVRRRLVRRD